MAKRFETISSQKLGKFAIWDGLRGKIYEDDLIEEEATKRARNLNKLDSNGKLL